MATMSDDEGPRSGSPVEIGDDESAAAAADPPDGPADESDAPATTDDVVAANTTDRRTISPRVQISWGLRMLVGVVLLTFGASFLAMTLEPVPSWAGAALGVVLLGLGSVWVHLRYRVWCYEVRADALYLERGVLTHVRTIAPYVRIQHVDTQRGPLERWLGLSTLVVYTAGTRGADVSVQGLTPEEARDLQERVKQLAIEAEGGDAV
jgi:membrane protein YdbS with pleckstrin-like domain